VKGYWEFLYDSSVLTMFDYYRREKRQLGRKKRWWQGKRKRRKETMLRELTQ